MNSQINPKIMQEKVKFYFENKIKIHLGLKDKEWLNGEIKKVKEDSFIFHEDKKGDLLVFFEEVYRISVYDKKD